MADGSQRVFGSAKLIAACTLLSRVTGLLRDIVLNRVLGQDWVLDGWSFGFQIPNLFRRLFGEGALSALFVPAFTETLDRDGKPAAADLLARVAALIVIILSGLTLLIEAVVATLWLTLPPEPMRRLMLGLTGVMAPFMISICTLALLSSVLNCLHHFALPALAPIVLNVCNIIGARYVGPALSDRREVQVYGIAISVLVASVLQIVIVLPVLRRHGLRLTLTPRFDDPRLRTMLRMFLPVLLGQGVLLVNVYLDSQVCTLLTRGPDQPETFHLLGRDIGYPLAGGALAAVSNAQRLYQFPLGVLAISLATAAFPALARHATRADLPSLRAATGDALRLALFEGLPAGIMMILLAQPIVAMLFEGGRFTPAASARAATVLACYGLGMWAFCAQQIVTRTFYALKDTLTPMWIGCALVALNQLLNLTLIWHPRIREAAFGVSTSITSALFVLIGLLLLRRRTGGRLGGRVLFAACIRMGIAAAVAGGVAWSIRAALPAAPFGLSAGAAARVVRCLLPLSAAGVAYLAAAWALRMDEVRWLLGRSAARV
ncbi:MAG: murein biosynthesis integral membrane protein MurJ [Phycisphaerae bacterium]